MGFHIIGVVSVFMIFFASPNCYMTALSLPVPDPNGHKVICLSFLFTSSEKHKAEIKDRKVLEILQTKDNTIQELEQVQYIFIQHFMTGIAFYIFVFCMSFI